LGDIVLTKPTAKCGPSLPRPSRAIRDPTQSAGLGAVAQQFDKGKSHPIRLAVSIFPPANSPRGAFAESQGTPQADLGQPKAFSDLPYVFRFDHA